METHVKRVRRRRQSADRAPARTGRAIIFGLALSCGFVLGFLSLSYVPRAYSGWREARLLKRATEQLQNQQLEPASKTAHAMLELRPDSLPAYRLLADITEKQKRSETVAYRAQIARLLP